jgi:hypothetical protein
VLKAMSMSKLKLATMMMLVVVSAAGAGLFAYQAATGQDKAAAATAPTSELWGRSGELWTPQSRLPDFSFAGYRSGDAPIPDLPVRANVKDFGARGDGETDDTQAFVKALSTVVDGAVLVPAGRYRITDVLRIERSRVVLRGEGRNRTVLFFPKPLAEMIGPAPDWAGSKTAKGNWSWGGGVLWLTGRDEGTRIAGVAAPARRGDRVLALSSARGIVPGATVRLLMREATDGSLGRHPCTRTSPRREPA